jgi:hypothetical protein
MQVLTNRKQVLTPQVIQNMLPCYNLSSGISKVYAKFGLNRSINVAIIQVLTHHKRIFTTWC